MLVGGMSCSPLARCLENLPDFGLYTMFHGLALQGECGEGCFTWAFSCIYSDSFFAAMGEQVTSVVTS